MITFSESLVLHDLNKVCCRIAVQYAVRKVEEYSRTGIAFVLLKLQKLQMFVHMGKNGSNCARCLKFEMPLFHMCTHL
jgi:hypothetical protein